VPEINVHRNVQDTIVAIHAQASNARLTALVASVVINAKARVVRLDVRLTSVPGAAPVKAVHRSVQDTTVLRVAAVKTVLQGARGSADRTVQVPTVPANVLGQVVGTVAQVKDVQLIAWEMAVEMTKPMSKKEATLLSQAAGKT
jgi:hypothetical protein